MFASSPNTSVEDEEELQPSISSVAHSITSVISQTQSRASYYVNLMEHYLGTKFSPPTRLLALAAVSGFAMTSTLAGQPAITQNILEKSQKSLMDHELTSGYTKVEDSYLLSPDASLEMHLLELKTSHEQGLALAESQLRDAREVIASERKAIGTIKHEKVEAVESLNLSVEAVARLERELESLEIANAHDIKVLQAGAQLTRDREIADSSQLAALQEELHTMSLSRSLLEEQYAATLKDIEGLKIEMNEARRIHDLEMQSTISSLTAELELEKSKRLDFEKRLEQLDAESQNLHADLQTLNTERGILKNDQSQLLASKDALLKNIETLKTRDELRRKELIEEHTTLQEDLKLHIQRQQKDLDDMSARHQLEIRKRQALHEGEISHMQQTFESTRIEVKKLQLTFQKVHTDLEQRTLTLNQTEKRLEALELENQRLSQLSAQKDASEKSIREELEKFRAKKMARRASKERRAQKFAMDNTPMPIDEPGSGPDRHSAEYVHGTPVTPLSGSKQITTPSPISTGRLGAQLHFESGSSASNSPTSMHSKVVPRHRISSIGRVIPFADAEARPSLHAVHSDDRLDSRSVKSLKFEDQRVIRKSSRFITGQSDHTHYGN